MSPAWTPYFFFDQFFTGGLKAAQALAAVGIACVDKRMKNPDVDPNRRDILHYLLIAKDPTTGGNLPNAEIKAEALTQWGHPSPPRRRKKKKKKEKKLTHCYIYRLIAGSDTTGNTITHLIDMLIRNPDKCVKLREELDRTYPSPLPSDFVAMFADCKDLPYTEAVIYETLRLRTTVSVGLPRVVPTDMYVCGHFFKNGTVLSTPTYTVHRDERVWGPDALDFRPERWIVGNRAEMEANFLGFSAGPRAW